MSLAVPPVGSVCLRCGVVMGRQTVWMEVMSSNVLPFVALVRCRVSVGTSVLTTRTSVMAPFIAGMPQMKV